MYLELEHIRDHELNCIFYSKRMCSLSNGDFFDIFGPSFFFFFDIFKVIAVLVKKEKRDKIADLV